MWLTTRQVAQLAGCDIRTVARACRDGKITARRGAGAQPTTRLTLQRGSRQQVWQIDPVSGRRWAAEWRHASLDRL